MLTHPVDLPVEREDECSGMLGHGIGRVGRHVRHLHHQHTDDTHSENLRKDRRGDEKRRASSI
jgi:hypothetical protein